MRVEVPETLPEVRADAVLLERVLVNLLGNALRYSPAGPAAAGRGELPCGPVEIRVVDRGPGVPEDAAASRCSRRSSGSATATTPPASGSAWPCRGASPTAMGGTLAADDTPGGGLTMTVTLPGGSSVETAGATVAGEDVVSRVLVVDDEPQILRALVVNMRARGYDVHAAADGARRCGWPGSTRPTWWSSTSACPTWRAPR